MFLYTRLKKKNRRTVPIIQSFSFMFLAKNPLYFILRPFLGQFFFKDEQFTQS
jgi:hypothetical protein